MPRIGAQPAGYDPLPDPRRGGGPAFPAWWHAGDRDRSAWWPVRRAAARSDASGARASRGAEVPKDLTAGRRGRASAVGRDEPDRYKWDARASDSRVGSSACPDEASRARLPGASQAGRPCRPLAVRSVEPRAVPRDLAWPAAARDCRLPRVAAPRVDPNVGLRVGLGVVPGVDLARRVAREHRVLPGVASSAVSECLAPDAPAARAAAHLAESFLKHVLKGRVPERMLETIREWAPAEELPEGRRDRTAWAAADPK
jgi:hypothetical protein